MNYDEWKTSEGPQYDPQGYVEYVTDDYLQHECDSCPDLADTRVEIEMYGHFIGVDYRCFKCHSEICEEVRKGKI